MSHPEYEKKKILLKDDDYHYHPSHVTLPITQVGELRREIQNVYFDQNTFLQVCLFAEHLCYFLFTFPRLLVPSFGDCCEYSYFSHVQLLTNNTYTSSLLSTSYLL